MSGDTIDEDTVDEGIVDGTTQGVLDMLAPIGAVDARRLFGTWGLYLDDRIFGIVHDEVVYFRTSPETVAQYVAAGSQPFMYRRGDGRSTVMQYHEVPPHVLADPDVACAWAYIAATATA